jgi:galactose mutarotase-like enzyme
MWTQMNKADASSPADETLKTAVLENDALRITVLPSLGGKIASIQLLPEGEELLQRPLRPYAPRFRYMNFDAGDASGWDECLPSVAACEVQTASGAAKVPDHGDFWQVAWTVESQSSSAITLSAEGFSLPLRFSRTLQLDGSSLQASYRVRNLSAEPVEYLWSAHPSFAIEQGDRIVLPESVKEVTVEGSAQDRLGKQGAKHAWPHTKLANQQPVDLSIAGGADDGVGDKLFAPSSAEGWCAIERKRLKRRVAFHFDSQQLPYLGLWLCYGGWPAQQAARQHCVAMEPCTAEGDSLAVAAQEGRARRLAPQAEDNWVLELRVTGVS